MSRARHDLGGPSNSPTAEARSAGKGGIDKAQRVKVAIAVGVLVVATGLIVYQTGLLASKPMPLAAQPGAESDDEKNIDDPGQPPPKSGFSGRATPMK